MEIDFRQINNIEIIPVEFALVEGGTYQMGDHFNVWNSDELPLHSVTVSDFYMGTAEVTQAEWTQYMPDKDWSDGTGDKNPAFDVSWFEIIKYCNLRSMAEGLTPCYTISGSTDPDNWGAVPESPNSTWDAAICNWSANGYRLPTEAEWEYAARGGTHNADNYLYSGSDIIDDVAWYDGNNDPWGYKPVGTKVANQLGLYDMSGNTREWCWDWFGAYTSDAQTNPTGPTTGTERVLRDGFWYSYAWNCRVSIRTSFIPFFGFSYPTVDSCGFRLARTP
ncbi:MAG: SUMF1/EgtB/PvdO family nonheme iron enzyme [Candidatus Delongbacteria bacterium]|nr:SUMF1/EgtB/PvdO family nonheme iron enzyme [Candidatus Delongbacteria bacterium]